MQRGGEGDVYVYVQLLPRDRLCCFQLGWGEPFLSGRVPLLGVWRADYMHMGLSERLAVTGWGGNGGQRECGPSPGARLSWCHLQQPGHPTCCQLNTGRGQAFWEEKALQ